MRVCIHNETKGAIEQDRENQRLRDDLQTTERERERDRKREKERWRSTGIDRNRDRDREIVWEDMKRGKTTDRQTEIRIENETNTQADRLERCEKDRKKRQRKQKKITEERKQESKKEKKNI